jgi:hypothetical protein
MFIEELSTILERFRIWGVDFMGSFYVFTRGG